MEAIISRTPGRRLDVAAAEWLRATRRLSHALGREVASVLVRYSRAAMLLRGGPRPIRRI